MCRHRGQCLCGVCVCVCVCSGGTTGLSLESVYSSLRSELHRAHAYVKRRFHQSDFTVHCGLGKQMNVRRGEVEDGVLEGQGGVW